MREVVMSLQIYGFYIVVLFSYRVGEHQMEKCLFFLFLGDFHKSFIHAEKGWTHPVCPGVEDDGTFFSPKVKQKTIALSSKNYWLQCKVTHNRSAKEIVHYLQAVKQDTNHLTELSAQSSLSIHAMLENEMATQFLKKTISHVSFKMTWH